MSGSCIEKIECPKCHNHNLQVFEEEGTYTGYCFNGCGYFPSPYGDIGLEAPRKAVQKRSPEEVENDLQAIDALPSADLADRGLTKATLDYFNVKVGYSETDGKSIALHFYPYFKEGKRSGYRVRCVSPKKFWMTGDAKENELFGWKQAVATGAKKLILTEGEIDCLSVYQVLKENSRGTAYEKYDPAVVSVSSGASGTKKELGRWQEEIRKSFKEIILCFDRDDAGKKATEAALQIFPEAKVVSLPAKDANAALVEGRKKALVSALWNASAPKNTRVISALDVYEAARKPAEYGLSYPWPAFTKLTKGMRFGETNYLGAGVKMGKSSVVDELAAHIILEHDLKVFMAKPEESNARTIQGVLGKVASKVFHDPDIPFDYDAFDNAAKIVGDKLRVLDLYQHLGWQSLKQDIIAQAHDGCKAVFCDPVSNLVNGVSAAETNTVLQEIAQDLAALAKDLDIAVFLFCHLRNPESGVPHERGGEVLSSQFTGSRAMARSCNGLWGLQGNKDPKLSEDERNLRQLVVIEDRAYGQTGIINLFYDRNTGRLNEIKDTA